MARYSDEALANLALRIAREAVQDALVMLAHQVGAGALDVEGLVDWKAERQQFVDQLLRCDSERTEWNRRAMAAEIELAELKASL